MSATKELMGELHKLVTEELMDRIKTGSATTADLSATIKFLKDNGIEALSAGNTRLTDLAASLPDFDEEDTGDVTYN